MTPVLITSAGYLHNPPPEADITVDLRRLLPADPDLDPALRGMTGLDNAVHASVATAGGRDLARVLASNIDQWAVQGGRVPTVAVMGAAGQHRSVVVAVEIARLLRAWEYDVTVTHRDLAPAGDGPDVTA